MVSSESREGVLARHVPDHPSSVVVGPAGSPVLPADRRPQRAAYSAASKSW
jgi:hypothetical protein